MTSSSRPISTRLRVLRHPCLLLGSAVGVCLAATAVAWVLVANREPVARAFRRRTQPRSSSGVRRADAGAAFSFLKSPARIFLSGIIAWMILVIAYASMGRTFPQLDERLGAFHLFMMGAVVFGVMASVAWVAHMIVLTRHHHHHPVTATPRRRLP